MLKKCNVLLGLLFTPTIVYTQTIELEQVNVVGQKPSKSELSGVSSTVKLSHTELKNMKGETLGETLGRISGIQNNYFGPNVGRPIIRGLSGQRVQILQNDVPLQDMAAISGNLATSSNLASVKQIQIVKSGVSSVLYGGKGIGGTVNLTDGAIPEMMPEVDFGGSINIQKGINALDEYKIQLQGNAQKNIAWYFDAAFGEILKRKIPRRSKDSICYDYGYLKSNTELRRQCQVEIERVGSSINPKYFPYISKFYLDNYMDPEYGLSEGDKYTQDPGNPYRGINPPNPDYVEGSPYYIENFGEAKEYVIYPNGRIPNSFLRTKQFNLGTSYIGESGYIGISVSHFLTQYGVPGFAYLTSQATEQAQGYLPVGVKNQTSRLTIKGSYTKPWWFIEKTDVQFAFQKANDKDMLGNVVSNGLKSYSDYYRLTFDHKPLLNNYLIGSFGFEWNKQKVSSLGVDSYLPKVNADSKGLFILEKVDLSPLVVEIGQRWDRIKYNVDTKNRSTSGGLGGAYSKDTTFAIQNSHLGLLFQPKEQWFIKLQHSWQQRAPEINELYADNSHYALLIEENGDGRLSKEKSKNWEATLGVNVANFVAELTWYQRKFSDFNYLGYTGISRNSLILKEWRQAPLTMSGIEVDLSYQHKTQYLGDWTWHLFADYVKSKLILPAIPADKSAVLSKQQIDAKHIGYLPNIPSSRVGGDIAVQYNRWKGFVSSTHYFKQKYVSKEVDSELKAKSFTLVDLGLSYVYPLNDKSYLELSFKINNVTNREARLNNSPLRFLAPLPGRNARIGIDFSF